MSGSAYKTNTIVCLIAVWLLFAFDSHRVVAAPHPMPPGMMYREDYEGASANLPSQSFLERMKDIVERKKDKIENEMEELAEEETFLELAEIKKEALEKEHQQQAQQEASVEDLPVPAAVYRNGPLRSGKRTSYMVLCHFKICNMGRKRTE